MTIFIPDPIATTHEGNQVVVRLRTSIWNDKNRGRLTTKRELTFLQRKCNGHNFVQEDIDNDGAEATMDRIVNINQCDDGLYYVIVCNVNRDYETGYIDDWDYKLCKFNQ
jgi:hypothetical protein